MTKPTPKTISPASACFALVLVAIAANPALAHVEAGQAGGFASGLLHPISGLDHVLAMIAVGLWGAQLGLPALWLLPVAFPMMMAFGDIVASWTVPSKMERA